MQLCKDEELRGEILQDVVRCMPENLYFRQPETQRILLDILFIFCKLNPDISYRQGMHEILAPILWVVERDAIDLGQSSKALGEDALIKAMFDADHIEHDAFTLFGQVMQSAKNFYEQTTTSGKENPMVARNRRIFSDMLPMVDDRLAKHLASIYIVPQVFLMRWIRLLFGREFAFDDILNVWDVIFAEDPTLEIVDHICLAMLLRIHWDLIEADYNVALTLLLKYPEPGQDLPPQMLVLDALYLRDHMDHHCGSHLVSKYTGRPIQHAGRPVTPPALQRNITTFSMPTAAKSTSLSNSLSPPRPTRQASNLEAVLQSTAKNIYARGEKLGIGKAVRSAVDEVHKKAQEIRDTQTPSAPVVRRRRRSRSALGPEAFQSKVKALEDRSKQLAKLLEGALSELWDYQKMVTQSDQESLCGGDPNNVEKLSMAIAKVQFVQVYLNDSGLAMPDEIDTEGPESGPSEKSTSGGEDTSIGSTLRTQPSRNKSPLPEHANAEHQSRLQLSQETMLRSGTEELADPSTFEEMPLSKPEPERQVPDVVIQSESGSSELNTRALPERSRTPDSLRSRPRLEQSPLSWMLGQQDSSTQPFNSSSPPPEQSRSRVSLFSANENTDKTNQERPGTGKQRKKSNDIDAQKDEEEFDLSSLRHGKSRKG